MQQACTFTKTQHTFEQKVQEKPRMYSIPYNCVLEKCLHKPRCWMMVISKLAVCKGVFKKYTELSICVFLPYATIL